ncbi:MAG: hypothetical protein LBE89_06110 [Helicobacteraceae bacterium]|jgi:hypothetical protein|nr:hypothetical protein [Helicobacteraceae bacterium]
MKGALFAASFIWILAYGSAGARADSKTEATARVNSGGFTAMTRSPIRLDFA